MSCVCVCARAPACVLIYVYHAGSIECWLHPGDKCFDRKLIASPWQLGPIFPFPLSLVYVSLSGGRFDMSITLTCINMLIYDSFSSLCVWERETHTHTFPYIWILDFTLCMCVFASQTQQSWSKHEFLHNAHFTLAALVLHPLIHSHFILKDYNSLTDYYHSDHWYKTTHINTYAHSNEIHIYIVMAIHPLFSPKTRDRLAKSSPSCCLDNPEEYFLVAMTTDDAHPVWLAGFYLDA